MLAGVKVHVDPRAKIPFVRPKLGIWQRQVPAAGGELVQSRAQATHVLTGDESPPAPDADKGQQQQQQHVVHFSWLESCLLQRERLPEAQFPPTTQAAQQQQQQQQSIGGSQAGDPDASVHLQASTLGAADLRSMLLHLLTGAPRPHWLVAHGRPGHVVLVMVPGLDRQLLQEQGHLLPHLQRRTLQQAVLQSQGRVEVPSQTLAALVGVPPPSGSSGGGHKRKRPESPAQAEMPPQEGAAQGAASLRFPPAFYTMTRRQMAAAGYPLAPADGSTQLPPGFASTEQLAGRAQPPAPITAASPQQQQQQQPEQQPEQVRQEQQVQHGDVDMDAVSRGKLQNGQRPAATPQQGRPGVVAVDCEMVITAQGFELARATLVDGGSGEVGGEVGGGALRGALLDELVVPDHPITDYNTKYSGITKEMLSSVPTRVADLQRMVSRHVGPQTLLVGHTLENDLKVMRLLHSNCIDTAALFPHTRGLPHRPSLKQLASRFLGKTIQGGAHDSQEDAEVTLQLAELKWKHGPTFGTLKDGYLHLFDVLGGTGRRVALVDRREVLTLHASVAARVVEVRSDEEVVEQVARLLTAPAHPPQQQHEQAPQQQQQAQRLQQQQKQPEQHQEQQHVTPPPPPQQQHQQQQKQPEQSLQQQYPQQQQQSPQQQQQSPQQQQKVQGAQQHGSHAGALDLVWCQLSELWMHYEDQAMALPSQTPPPNPAVALAAAAGDAQAEQLLRQTDALIERLASALPPGTLLVLLSGQGNSIMCRALQGELGLRRLSHMEQNARMAAARASPAVQALIGRAAQGVVRVLSVGPTLEGQPPQQLAAQQEAEGSPGQH